MQASTTLILIDNDMRRRAQLSHSLSTHRIHVEPFETVDELCRCWPTNGTILIHESGAVLRRADRFTTRQTGNLPYRLLTNRPE